MEKLAHTLRTSLNTLRILPVVCSAALKAGCCKACGFCVRKNEEPVETGSESMLPVNYDITFEQVAFRYEGSTHAAVYDINLSLPPNTITSLVGPVGCGKATLLRILMGYTKNFAGTIRIGGMDICDLPASVLETLVCMVHGNVFLFNDSILNNIRSARPEASDSEVQQAAAAGQCDCFIKGFRNGYKTSMCLAVPSLSKDELYCIGIARAFLKNSPIVMLYELPADAHPAVYEDLYELSQHRNVILLSDDRDIDLPVYQRVHMENGHILKKEYMQLTGVSEVDRTSFRQPASWEKRYSL